MKKLLLAALTVLAFIAYALFQRETGGATGMLSGTAMRPGTVGEASDIDYENGRYIGDIANTSWGNVQAQVVIEDNRIASISSEYPRDRPLSTKINDLAVPMLQQEAIQIQSAEVELVTGATVTSEGCIESLKDALNQAGG